MSRTTIAAAVAIALVVSACSSGNGAGDTGAGSPAPVSATSGSAVVYATPPPTTSAPPTSDQPPADGTQPAPAPTAIGTSTIATDSTTVTTVTTAPTIAPVPFGDLEVVVYPVPDGSRPHDVAPALDGGVWYTAQRAGALGHLDPVTGETRHIPLGDGSAPHGVIIDSDGVAWVTDGGLNAIVSVDPDTDAVTTYPLPADAPGANLNTAAFDGTGRLWFTGQTGYYGVLDPASGVIDAFSAPRGRGPYGIAATPDGVIYFASLAGSYVGQVAADGSVIEIDPPTPTQGARRVWSDSTGAVWVSEWSSGQLSRFDPGTGDWSVWPLPGDDPSAYAVYVDVTDQVWVSDFGGNAMHRFDPVREVFETFPLPAEPSEVRQILGRGHEIWGAQSADDSLIVIRPAT